MTMIAEEPCNILKRRKRIFSPSAFGAAAAGTGAFGGRARAVGLAGAGAGVTLAAPTGFLLAAPGQFAWTTWLQSSPARPDTIAT